MALHSAILVLLCENPGSRQNLVYRFDRSLGFFVNATPQQVNRTLAMMEDNGWVRTTPAAEPDHPDEAVYTVAAVGRAELARWLAEPPPPRGSSTIDARIRELALKVRGASYGDVAAVRGHVVELRAERATRLDVYRAIEKSQFPDPASLTGAALHQYLVLHGGIVTEEVAVRWLDEVTETL